MGSGGLEFEIADRGMIGRRETGRPVSAGASAAGAARRDLDPTVRGCIVGGATGAPRLRSGSRGPAAGSHRLV